MQCQTISWNQGSFPPSSTYLHEWFKDAINHNRFKYRVEKEGLDSLSESESAQLLDFVSQNGTLHLLADDSVMEVLLAKGANPNYLDHRGRTCLACVTSLAAFERLLKYGAKYESREGNFTTALEFAVDRIHSKDWPPEITITIFTYGKEEALKSNALCLRRLLWICRNHSKAAEFFSTFAKDLCEKEPQTAAQVVITFFSSSADLSPLLFNIIENKRLPKEYIDLVLRNPNVFATCVANKELLSKLKGHFGITFLFDYFVSALKSHKKLQHATQFLRCLKYLKDDLPEMGEPAKEECVAYIKALQTKTKKFIWDVIQPNAPLEEFFLLPQIGISPDWTDCTFHRNSLFCEEILSSDKVGHFIESTKVNCHHRDKYGLNALDFFCKDFLGVRHFTHTIKVLTDRNLFLTDFINIPFCRERFPNDYYYQTLLAMFINSSRVPHWFSKLKRSEQNKIIDAALLLPSYKKKYDKEPAQPAVFENPIQTELSEKLAPSMSSWRGVIPAETVGLIPQYPLASFAIATIRDRFENKRKPLHVEILLKNFTQNDTIAFCHYIFEHPDFFSIIYKSYFVVSRIDYYQRGSLTDLSREFVSKMLFTMHNFRNDESEDALKVQEAFKKRLPVIPIDNLSFSEPAEFLGRTATFSFYEGRQALKIIKPNENLQHFLQEFSVTQGFREAVAKGFQTNFAKPIAVYSIRQLSLSPDNPFKYVYHYKASHGLFEYPQDLKEEEFDKALEMATHDAAKMVPMNVLPDMVPFYHDEEDGRKYFPLVDLMLYISAKYSNVRFAAAGGAGQLENPFLKLWKPNIRRSGLADLRDAVLLDGRERYSKELYSIPSEYACSKIFYQMHGLSTIMLVNILLRVERCKDNHTLDWQDESFNQYLGEKIKQTYIQLISSYTGRNRDECQAFASAAIDWATMAREIAFFIDDSEKGYKNWVAAGKVPENLFPGIEVIFEAASAENFSPEKGFNGNIGPTNGPLGWAEFEKMLKTLIFPVLVTQKPDTPSSRNECNQS